MLRPSTVLKIYYAVSFFVGCLLSVAVATHMRSHDIGARGAALTTLCWNAVFVMILPVVMDWSQSKYFKARFVQLEEVSELNPELASLLSQKCKELSLARLRVAVVDGPHREVFSYNLWGCNPRLVVPSSALDPQHFASMLPSVEAELGSFANHDHTIMFLLFAAVQIMLEQTLMLVH
jgi:hypothetical protein